MKPAVETELLATLKERFEKNIERHKGIDWNVVRAKLEASPRKLRTLFEMKNSGGEPDVVGYDRKADKVTFFDCSPESPKGRRSLCYDGEALDSRKENREFDLKTSSWVRTPTSVRKLCGALYGADSYYAARGFRGRVDV